ncbi:MAG: cytochrome c biogenesis protein CcdA [Phycisphaerae bacterium]
MHLGHILAATIMAAAGGAVGMQPQTSVAKNAPTAFVSAEAVVSDTQVRPGQTFHVAVVMHVAEGWVFYSPSPGGGKFMPLPAEIAVHAGSLSVGAVLWPADREHPTNVGDAVVSTFVYTGQAVAYVPVTVPDDAPAGRVEIPITVTGQVCSEKEFKCVPVHASAAVEVRVNSAAVANEAWTESLRSGLASAKPADQLHAAAAFPQSGSVQASRLSVWGGLGLALLAGLIMNVMPCVLPVIPIRILSVVELARQSRRRFVTVGLAFAGGVALFFVALAGANVVLHLAMGRALDWGRHFQSAPFRLGMAFVIVAVAANLFGVFTVSVPRRLAALGGAPGGQGHLASAGMGLMMAVLATPCSFAILVLAFAWAQLQPLWLGSLAIVLIGVGMAAPHALLATMPGLLNRLPRPGRWMELLRQAMGFVLLLVAVWLIGTLSADTAVARAAAYAVVLVFGLWAWGTWVRYDWPLPGKLALRGLATALAVAAGVWLLSPPRGPAVKFQPFDQPRIAQANGAGQIVLVDFTASWCLSCKAVDYLIYDRPEVARELAARNVLPMRGDVTAADAPANALLYDTLHGAPPLTVIFPPAGPPIRLEGKFSRQDLTAALDGAWRR